MRVITGIAKGHTLKTLKGDATRPTAQRVKEAMFSAIQFDIEGRRVLDLFAGCGQLGIESLSRGAKSCVFVDQSKSAVQVIEENVAAVRLPGRVICTGATRFLATCRDTFDLVFLDPPYGMDCIPDLLPALLPRLSPYAIVVCEHAATQVLPECFGDFIASATKRYGQVGVTIYRTN